MDLRNGSLAEIPNNLHHFGLPLALNDEAQETFKECVAALTAMRYGPEGPPENTTFAEIEEFGHEVGRMLGRAVDQRLTDQHAEQFQKAAACPTCQTVCEPKPTPATRKIQTSDGQVPNPTRRSL